MLSYVLLWRQFLFRWSCISTLCCHQYLSHNGRLSPPPFICNQTPFQKHNSLHYVSNAGWIGLWRHGLCCTSVSVTLLKCQAQVIDYCEISQWLGNSPLQTRKKMVFHPPKDAMDWFVGILNEFSAPLHNFIMGLFACHGRLLSCSILWPWEEKFLQKETVCFNTDSRQHSTVAMRVIVCWSLFSLLQRE